MTVVCECICEVHAALLSPNKANILAKHGYGTAEPSAIGSKETPLRYSRGSWVAIFLYLATLPPKHKSLLLLASPIALMDLNNKSINIILLLDPEVGFDSITCGIID